MLQHKLRLAQALGKSGKIEESDSLFRDVLSTATETDHKSPLVVETAEKERDFFVNTIVDLLDVPNAPPKDGQRAHEFAIPARKISRQENLDETPTSFKAYSLVRACALSHTLKENWSSLGMNSRFLLSQPCGSKMRMSEFYPIPEHHGLKGMKTAI